MNDSQNTDEHELEKIRMKKMQALMEQKKRQENAQKQTVSIQDKVDFVLKVVLEPDAYQHLKHLQQNEPNVYQYIFNELVGQEVVQNIDYLIAIIQRQGGVPRRIPRDVIVYLERKAKGIKSQIRVKRGDEVMDLGSYLKKE
jgi:DNA-binding TFAR19-related protein (PDSD5 family)